MSRTRLTLLTVLLALAAGPLLAKKPSKAPKKDDEVVEINENDPAMKAAFKQAQSSLDTFLAAVIPSNPKFDAVAIRIAVHDGKKTEYFWATPFKIDGDGFKGSINNVPRVVNNIKYGQEWSFKRTDVVDWMYVDTQAKVMHGNFTTCAQLTKAPPAHAKEMKKVYGLDCER